ncbi:chemotaxis protein CheW [Shimia ponticola]|uniref:chemotaxis protein CheW n=1 Tax=Shimia ponticola TaxID=2582893 RepID=UPI0011BF0BF7|nr:chemotaxis protein CheW [Shimia ponticola]
MNQDSPAMNPIELLSFGLAGQAYAVDIMAVREIRGWVEPTALPGTPDYVCGVINLRGTVLPILNLATRLGLEAHQVSDRSVVIVLTVASRTFGITVDAVSDILTVDPAAIQPPPDGVQEHSKGFVSALCLLDDQMIRLLSPDTLITQDGALAA